MNKFLEIIILVMPLSDHLFGLSKLLNYLSKCPDELHCGLAY